MSLAFRKLLVISFAVVGVSGAYAQQWKITDLGTLPGGNTSFAYAVNGHGLVVGEGNDAANACCRRPFIWQGGVITALPLPSGTAGGSLGAAGINDLGDVVGITLSNSFGYRGVRWSGGSPTYLPIAQGSTQAIPFSINNSGVAAGRSQGGSTSFATTWAGSAANPLSVPTGGNGNSEARAISANGTIVGFATIGGVGTFATMWNGSTPTLLPRLSGQLSSEARAINDSGVIVGYGVSGGAGRALIWNGGTIAELPYPSGFSSGEANGINNGGTIVGSSYKGGTIQTPIIWQAGVPYDLFANSDASGKGWVSGVAKGINDQGQIVGYGNIAGQTHAFLLNPPLSVELLDPVPLDDPSTSLLDGAAITKDIQRLSHYGRVVQGIAADGVAQVVLRIRTSIVGQDITVQVAPDQCVGRTSNQCIEEYGRIFDPINPPPDIFGSIYYGSVTVTSQATPDGPMAFAVYRAPIDFTRSEDVRFQMMDSATRTRTTSLSVNSISVSLQIARAPVGFVHGLWADDASTWNPSFQAILNNNSIFFARELNYFGSVPNVSASNPAHDTSVLQTKLRESALGLEPASDIVFALTKRLVDEYRQSQSLAASSVALVAHSMGGPVSRTITTRPNYKEPNNFGRGIVQKLITIASPHLGTPFATQGLQNANTCIRNLLASKGQISAITFVQSSAFSSTIIPGAVNDLIGNGQTLAGSSAALTRIAASSVPKIPVAYLGGRTDAANLSGLSGLSVPKYLRFKCPRDPLTLALTPEFWNSIYPNQPNDAIVPVTSAASGYGVFAATPLIGVIHSAGTGNLGFNGPDILSSAITVENVKKLLNTSPSASSVFVMTPK